jgi:hypothetical protein
VDITCSYGVSRSAEVPGTDGCITWEHLARILEHIKVDPNVEIIQGFHVTSDGIFLKLAQIHERR